MIGQAIMYKTKAGNGQDENLTTKTSNTNNQSPAPESQFLRGKINFGAVHETADE